MDRETVAELARVAASDETPEEFRLAADDIIRRGVDTT